MNLLEMIDVSMGYGPANRRSHVLEGVNLAVRENEFVAVVGFSGSGKTTLISLLAGLLQPDQGAVLKRGQKIERPGPDLGMVFQNYSLLPWLTVHGNIDLAVKQVRRDLSRKARRFHVEHYIDLVGLSHAARKRPAELSGGMRQRVSLARTLAIQPEVLLLDEPLGALDALNRAALQDEILRIWEADRRTVVLITNDVDEAILMADRIIPLNPGPGATLGPSFGVSLPRPRDRASLNYNPEFKGIRRDITGYLMSVNATARHLTVAHTPPLPDVKPLRIAAA